MRFENGDLVTRREGRLWTVERLYDGDTEMLYILTFYLPRFLDHPFREKMITIFHELWHVSPHFNGDLRRFEGRCYAHTGSQEQYDAEMALLADRYLSLAPPASLVGFLQYGFDELQQHHGRVFGTIISHPKLIPVD